MLQILLYSQRFVCLSKIWLSLLIGLEKSKLVSFMIFFFYFQIQREITFYFYLPEFVFVFCYLCFAEAVSMTRSIWGWTPGVYKAPEIICKFLRYADFFEICWFFWNSFYQLLRGTLMTKMLGTTGFIRTQSRTLIKCGYYSM